MRLLDPIKKGLVLYGDSRHDPAPPARLSVYGTAYEEEGKLHDALEFFWRAGDHEGMKRIGERAIADGDFFLFRQAASYLGKKPEPDELVGLMKNAQERGKLFFALMAAREAGDERAAAEIKRKMEGDADGRETPKK
jgi:hypothetical protein